LAGSNSIEGLRTGRRSEQAEDAVDDRLVLALDRVVLELIEETKNGLVNLTSFVDPTDTDIEPETLVIANPLWHGVSGTEIFRVQQLQVSILSYITDSRSGYCVLAKAAVITVSLFMSILYCLLFTVFSSTGKLLFRSVLVAVLVAERSNYQA